MEPIETVKSFGLLSVVIMTSAGSFMVWKGPRDKTKSVSAHAGTANKKLYILYALAFVTATILFYLFCMLWFIPTFNSSFGFNIFLNLMTILLVLTALIPESGKKVKAHKIVAYGFALMMLFLLFFVALSENISLVARLLTRVSILWMALGWYLMFFSPYKIQVRSYYLLFQYSYVIVFCLSILAATYIK